jgi:hypothetical protein
MDGKASLLSIIETAERLHAMAENAVLPLPNLLAIARDLDREARELEQVLIRTGQLAAHWRAEEAAEAG